MIHKFYSKGKLLITGEYFVLEGSKAFALPLRLGQKMLVTYPEKDNYELTWITTIKNNSWFWGRFNLNNLDLIDTSHKEKAIYIQQLLKQIRQRSDVLNDVSSLKISTDIEFSIQWGLGSSSTLISNLAYWANINPYELLSSIFDGSGYDIACARADNPILYQRNNEPNVQSVNFDPDFSEQIYFVYLGKKQDSQNSILQNREKINGKQKEIQKISDITKSIIQAKSLKEFEAYVIEHEEIVSKAIKKETVKSKYFPDFNGTIKSLGAWGGDFIMATYAGNHDYVQHYFNDKGLKVVFPYKKLVL